MESSSKKYISEGELRSHNKKDDLWISIKGKVYDVSHWVQNHPGGTLPLLYFGGQDVTDVFLSHHPSSAWKLLDKIFVGYQLRDYKVSEISKDYRNLFYEFQKMGVFENKGHAMLISIILLLMLFSLSVYGVLFITNNFALHLLCAGLLGFFWNQIFFVMHDCGHYQAMINTRCNKFAQFVFTCFNGMSSTWWKMDHNAHHIACNSLEYDPNTQFMPVLATSPELFQSLTSYYYRKKMNFGSFTSLLTRYQHWTLFPALTILRIYFVALSFGVLLRKKNVKDRVQDLVGMLVFLVWFSLLVSSLPDWFERIGFVSVAFSVTGIQSLQFAINHLSCDIYVGPLSGENWLEKQIIGSLNITCSPWMDWFHGGLQFQIEHHLFPRMPKTQLRNIAPYVEELCKKQNLPYNKASFWEATTLFYKSTRNAALQARNFNNNPTHGKFE